MHRGGDYDDTTSRNGPQRVGGVSPGTNPKSWTYSEGWLLGRLAKAFYFLLADRELATGLTHTHTTSQTTQ